MSRASFRTVFRFEPSDSSIFDIRLEKPARSVAYSLIWRSEPMTRVLMLSIVDCSTGILPSKPWCSLRRGSVPGESSEANEKQNHNHPQNSGTARVRFMLAVILLNIILRSSSAVRKALHQTKTDKGVRKISITRG